jgi:hypothetical protein
MQGLSLSFLKEQPAISIAGFFRACGVRTRQKQGKTRQSATLRIRQKFGKHRQLVGTMAHLKKGENGIYGIYRTKHFEEFVNIIKRVVQRVFLPIKKGRQNVSHYVGFSYKPYTQAPHNRTHEKGYLRTIVQLKGICSYIGQNCIMDQLTFYIIALIIGAIVIYFVVRAAVSSANKDLSKEMKLMNQFMMRQLKNTGSTSEDVQADIDHVYKK